MSLPKPNKTIGDQIRDFIHHEVDYDLFKRSCGNHSEVVVKQKWEAFQQAWPTIAYSLPTLINAFALEHRVDASNALDALVMVEQAPPFDCVARGYSSHDRWWHFILMSGRDVWVRNPHPDRTEYQDLLADYDSLHDNAGATLTLDDADADEFADLFLEEFHLWDWAD